MVPVALTIAGSDPSGGAGIQADLKTFHQHRVFGTSAITLLTVQNTVSVSHVEILSADLVTRQMNAVLSDIPPNAAKTGALGSVEVVRAVAALASSFTFPLIVDPVMMSKHGSRLISPDAEAALRDELLPLAYLVTPNIPEAELLCSMEIRDQADMLRAARRISALGCNAVLIKAGHLDGPPVDLLLEGEEVTHFAGTRIDSQHTHGTGCTLSAAITANLALGMTLNAAVDGAKRFVQSAIQTAPALGRGNGPLNHWAPR
jgi:hydroxymethylpyrimidine/phosphomethylpyrimidine kinase